MTLKGYLLYPFALDPDGIILASSMEEALVLLGAKLCSQVNNDEWEVVFPISCFQPPPLGSEEERMTDGMWIYRIPAQGGKLITLLLNLGEEIGLVLRLKELPLVS